MRDEILAMDILNLYENFIKKKFTVYFWRKKLVPVSLVSFRDIFAENQ